MILALKGRELLKFQAERTIWPLEFGSKGHIMYKSPTFLPGFVFSRLSATLIRLPSPLLE